MPPSIHTFSDEINYLVWRYLRESSNKYPFSYPRPSSTNTRVLDLGQTAWTLEAEIKSKNGKDVAALHEEFMRNPPMDLTKRLRMSMQYQEVLKHMSEEGDLPCTAPFTLLHEHKCNKGDESRVPITDVLERPWQLEPANFPHGEPLQLTTSIQQPRQSRRLNREENGSNGPITTTNVFQKSRLPPTAAKRRKPNNAPPNNSLPVGIVEEEESNVDDEMDEDTVVMNGEDVVMKDSTSVKSESEMIQIIPNDGPIQFGDYNTFIAAWNDQGVLATGQDGMVRMWTVQPRVGQVRVEEQHTSFPTNASGDITSLCWHPNDSLLATGTFTGLTTIWNIDGSLRSSLPSPNGPIFNLKFNPSGSFLVTCSANGVFEIYNTRDWLSIFKLPAAGRVWESKPNAPCVAWIDDTRLAILGPYTTNPVVNCWQFDESPVNSPSSPFLQFIGHEGLINDVQYDNTSGFIATASEDQSVRLWKLGKSSPYHEFRNHTASVRAVAFQPTPQTQAQTQTTDSETTPHRVVLASASSDGTISLYDVTNFNLLHSIGPQIHNFPGDQISCISWSPDGRFLCTGDLEGTVGVWEYRESTVDAPRPFAIWAPERIREDQDDPLPNGTNGHKDDLDRPVHRIHWQKNGQSFVVCRENRRVALIDWPLEQNQ